MHTTQTHTHIQDTSRDGDGDGGGQSVTQQINNTSLGMLKGFLQAGPETSLSASMLAEPWAKPPTSKQT